MPSDVKVAIGGPIESSPVVSGSTLYVGSDDGKLYAVSATNKNFFGRGHSAGPSRPRPPCRDRRWSSARVNTVYGLDATTGAVLWTGATGGTVSSSPAIVGGTVYIGSQDGMLYAFPLNCAGVCTPRWTASTGGAIESSPAVAQR